MTVDHYKEAKVHMSRHGRRSSFIKGGDSGTNFQKVLASVEIAGYRLSHENELALNNLFTVIAWQGGIQSEGCSPEGFLYEISLLSYIQQLL